MADTPAPKLFGRPMIPTNVGWIASYAELWCCIQRAGSTFDAFIGDTAVACAEELAFCEAQLELELRKIHVALSGEVR